MIFFLLVFHLLVTLVMIGVVLLQKGEDAGAGMAGNSTGMFSARGAKNVLTRATAILATLFFANCLLLAVLVQKNSRLVISKTSDEKDRSDSPQKETSPELPRNRSDSFQKESGSKLPQKSAPVPQPKKPAVPSTPNKVSPRS